MSTAEDHERWVPVDSFGARLALIRQARGWNVRSAAEACGVGEKSWRDWEDGKSPRDYETICGRIAMASGCDIRWLKAGGPLRSNWPDGQPGGLTIWYSDALADAA